MLADTSTNYVAIGTKNNLGLILSILGYIQEFFTAGS
jgi:hypothetical protein